MNWALGIAAVFIVFYLVGKYNYKKRIKKLRLSLIENWGKQKKQGYWNFFVIAKYFENNRHKKKAYHIISEKCKNDLDLEAIFKFIDRTSSKIGQQYLYCKMRTIGSVPLLFKFDALTKLFQSDEALRVDSQIHLLKLNSNESYYFEELINGVQLEKPRNLGLVKGLTLAAVLCIFFSFIYPILMLLLIPILAVNMVFHYQNKNNVNYYLQGVGQLSKALKVSEKLIQLPGIKSHFRDFSFVKKIRAIQLKTEFISFEKNINNEYLFVVWFFVEIIKTLFNIEYLVFYSFLSAIKKEKEAIEKLFLFIGEIDAAISTASVKAGEEQICAPNFVEKREISTQGIYHPIIENCVVNDLNLIDKGMLLTGSNMSGKTTFIRTVAINSILAQTLNICFAKEYSAPFFRVYSSIRISDNVLESTSYYLEEVITVKDLVDAAKSEEPCLFVLDEIFKGTNTVERISGGKAILAYLNKKSHVVLVSTHDIELTDLLEKEQFELYHFSEQIDNNELFFDHQLKEGKLKTRNAIKILEIYKYPDTIIQDAKSVEKDFFNS